MFVAMWILLSALAFLLLSAIAVLASPIKFRLFLRTAPAFRFTVGMRLLGGLTPTIPVVDSARQRSKKQKPKPKRKAVEEEPAKGKQRSFGNMQRTLASAPRLVTDLLRPIHIERLAVDGALGLDDPADTGQLFGVIQAVQHGLPQSETVSVALHPVFTGPHASAEVEARLKFIPLAFVPPGVRFAWRIFGPRS